LVVDAAVRVEAAVLDCDRRLAHPEARGAKGDRLPVALGRDRAEQRSVGRVDERVLADRDRPERAEGATRAKRGGRGDSTRNETADDDQEERPPCEQEPPP